MVSEHWRIEIVDNTIYVDNLRLWFIEMLLLLNDTIILPYKIILNNNNNQSLNDM